MRAFVFVLLLSTPFRGLAEPARPCEAAIAVPVDGETNVAPDAVFRIWKPACFAGEPTLLDARGTALPFDLTPSGVACPGEACFDLVPRAPFAADADFVLSLPTTARDHCGATAIPVRSRFHTAPRPTVLHLLPRLARPGPGDAEEVDGFEIRLSEDVDGAALALDPSVVRVEREDGLALRSGLEGGPDRLDLWVSMKMNAVRPPAGTRFRVHLAKELKFVSGASLPADIDVTTAFGVRDGQALAACPVLSTLSCGCTTGDLATLPLLLGLAVRRRRR